MYLFIFCMVLEGSKTNINTVVSTTTLLLYHIYDISNNVVMEFTTTLFLFFIYHLLECSNEI